MKYVAIIVFAFVIQVAHTAPQFEDNLFLDELMEMNVRMGNAILMAKYQRNSDTNAWKDNTPIEENSQDSTILGNKDPVSQSDGGDDDTVPVDKDYPSNTEESQNTEEETAEITTTTTATELVNEADNAQQTDAPYWGDETPNNKKGDGWFGNFFS